VILSDLRLVEPSPGPDAVRCSVCGLWTEQGWHRKPSENFNAWDIMRGGGFCEWCWAMLKQRPFRLHAWLGTQGRVDDELTSLGVGYDRSRHHWSAGESRARALSSSTDGLLRWRRRQGS
jgi:hypothetical protein